MSGILFLAHRLPFPPDRGDKIRSHHVLKALARLAPVHVGCFSETVSDRDQEVELANVAATHFMPARTRSLLPSLASALLSQCPLSVAAFGDAQLRQWVENTLAEQAIDTIYLFSGQMGQYLPADWHGRVVADLVDVDSAKFEAYAEQSRPPLRWAFAREARLLRQIEAELASRADCTLLVSEAEAALLRSRAPCAREVEAMGNGIDAAAFDPQSVPPHPELAAHRGPHLVFTGQMDYPPNIAAVQRTIERLMPAIRRVHPEARFHIVGRAPVTELVARDGEDGIHVWGEVPDVRPFLAAATLVIVPLEIARGVQNKVLEAMAMARPVLLTSQAALGIGAFSGEHFEVADSDQDLVEQALELIAEPSRARLMGEAARRYVIGQRSWPAMLARLPEFVGRASPGATAHAA